MSRILRNLPPCAQRGARAATTTNARFYLVPVQDEVPPMCLQIRPALAGRIGEIADRLCVVSIVGVGKHALAWNKKVLQGNSDSETRSIDRRARIRSRCFHFGVAPPTSSLAHPSFRSVSISRVPWLHGPGRTTLPTWMWYRRNPRVAASHPCSLPQMPCSSELRAESCIGLGGCPFHSAWRLLKCLTLPQPFSLAKETLEAQFSPDSSLPTARNIALAQESG